jgi:hypothetical protein
MASCADIRVRRWILLTFQQSFVESRHFKFSVRILCLKPSVFKKLFGASSYNMSEHGADAACSVRSYGAS